MARFCSSCGSEIRHLSDERRVVTVLFGDLVGFTALSETRDPETVKNLVDRCFARLATDITAFGGTVDKVIGDAIVALFGAPVAHEDDAERAVRAALRMQQTLAGFVSEVAGAELRMRIGINTGEVLVGALRAGGDYTAMGDVVNTAARLQTAAQPDEVLVGETTYSATDGVVSYESRGSLQAKGREAPVPVWVARRPLLPPGSRPRHHTVALVGRDRELSLLQAAWRTSTANQRASHLLLVGDAGLGKTRLAGELAAVAVADGGAVLEGRCVPYGEANAWWPVAEAVRTTCRVEASDSYERARSRTCERVAASLGEDVDAAEQDRVASGLLHLMGFEESLGGMEAAAARDEAVRALVAYIEGFARQSPILIIFSDLHWADDVVLELTDTLLERLARTPVTMLATAREQLLERWSPKPGRHNSVRIALDPLGPEAAAELLTSLLGHEPTPELAAAMLGRSGGNPFFIEELVSLMSDGSVQGGDGVTSMPVLPATLRGLVAARLDGLDVGPRTILQDAAVLGPGARSETCRRWRRRCTSRSTSKLRWRPWCPTTCSTSTSTTGRSGPTWSGRSPTAPSPRETGPSATKASPSGSSATGAGTSATTPSTAWPTTTGSPPSSPPSWATSSTVRSGTRPSTGSPRPPGVPPAPTCSPSPTACTRGRSI